MCNKTLLNLVLRVNTNSCSKQFNNAPYFIYNDQASFAMPNLKQLYITSRSLFLLSNKTNASIYCTSHRGEFNTKNDLTSTNISWHKSFCSGRNDTPKIMEFPQVIWPSVLKTARNWILSNFIIMRYFDEEFNLTDFVEGSKKAVEIVSGMISRGDIDSMAGLVTPEVIAEVRNSLNAFTLKQRQEFAITVEDIYFSFPYEVGVMFPNEDRNEGAHQSRFVEITMCYHVLQGWKELKESGVDPTQMNSLSMYQGKIFICNYRFIREFTKGVHDDWTINAINHFKPAAHLNI